MWLSGVKCATFSGGENSRKQLMSVQSFYPAQRFMSAGGEASRLAWLGRDDLVPPCYQPSGMMAGGMPPAAYSCLLARLLSAEDCVASPAVLICWQMRQPLARTLLAF